MPQQTGLQMPSRSLSNKKPPIPASSLWSGTKSPNWLYKTSTSFLRNTASNTKFTFCWTWTMAWLEPRCSNSSTTFSRRKTIGLSTAITLEPTDFMLDHRQTFLTNCLKEIDTEKIFDGKRLNQKPSITNSSGWSNMKICWPKTPRSSIP